MKKPFLILLMCSLMVAQTAFGGDESRPADYDDLPPVASQLISGFLTIQEVRQFVLVNREASAGAFSQLRPHLQRRRVSPHELELYFNPERGCFRGVEKIIIDADLLDFELIRLIPKRMKEIEVRGQIANLQDLTCLQYFENLESLKLTGTGLTDYSALENLTSLKRLDLSGHPGLNDISYLRGLTNLKHLDLNFTQVGDVAALRNLKNLESLNLSRTLVSDLSVLAELKRLKNLNFGFTQVSDLSALRGLTSLETLRMANTRVDDLSPLEDLLSLKGIDTSYTRVRSVFPLRNLLNLDLLSLYGTNVEDSSVLNCLTCRIQRHEGYGD